MCTKLSYIHRFCPHLQAILGLKMNIRYLLKYFVCTNVGTLETESLPILLHEFLKSYFGIHLTFKFYLNKFHLHYILHTYNNSCVTILLFNVNIYFTQKRFQNSHVKQECTRFETQNMSSRVLWKSCKYDNVQHLSVCRCSLFADDLRGVNKNDTAHKSIGQSLLNSWHFNYTSKHVNQSRHFGLSIILLKCCPSQIAEIIVVRSLAITDLFSRISIFSCLIQMYLKPLKTKISKLKNNSKQNY